MTRHRLPELTWTAVPLLVALAATSHAATLSVAGFDSPAIKAAVAQAQPADTVLLPEGIYTLTEAIALKSGVSLVGAGAGRTTLRYAGEQPTAMIAITGCEDVTVSDLTLDGQSTGKVATGVSGHNSRRVKLWRLAIRDLAAGPNGPHAIHFSGNAPTRENGVTDSAIADCELTNIGVASAWGAGIRLSWGSSRNQVIGNRINQTGRGGILTDNGSNDLVIRDNVVAGSQGEMLGIEVWGGCDRCVIEDNVIDHWLSVGGCDSCAVRRNTISATDGSFGFIGIEAIGSYLVFTDNVVDDGQIIGLSISNTNEKQYHYYENCDFLRCSQWAAQLQGESTGCRYYYFYRCKFSDTTVARGRVIYPGDDGNGFRVNGNTKDIVLDQCEMLNNARHGVQVTQSGPDGWLFDRCLIKGNKGVAFGSGPAVGGFEMPGCVVEGNGSNKLPPESPFAAPPPAIAPLIPEQAKVRQAVNFALVYQGDPAKLKQALWDFADGPPAAGNQVTHTYDLPGDYKVTVVAWDEAGRATRVQGAVKVR